MTVWSAAPRPCSGLPGAARLPELSVLLLEGARSGGAAARGGGRAEQHARGGCDAMGRLRSWHAKNERRQARESRASTRQVRRQLAVPRPTREPPLEHVAHVARRVRVAIDDAMEPRPGVIPPPHPWEPGGAGQRHDAPMNDAGHLYDCDGECRQRGRLPHSLPAGRQCQAEERRALLEQATGGFGAAGLERQHRAWTFHQRGHAARHGARGPRRTPAAAAAAAAAAGEREAAVPQGEGAAAAGEGVAAPEPPTRALHGPGVGAPESLETPSSQGSGRFVGRRRAGPARPSSPSPSCGAHRQCLLSRLAC